MTLQNKNTILSSYEEKAERVATIARAYAYRRRRNIAHTAHTLHRLEAAVSDLLDRRPGSDAERAARLLTELRALADAVRPFAHTAESIEAFGPAYDRARRAIAKAEGRCQALFTKLAPPEPVEEQLEPGPIAYTPRPARRRRDPNQLERLRQTIIAAQKRGARAAVLQSIVMTHGGRAARPNGMGDGPSLKALPPEKYAVVIAEVEALPLRHG
jgi:hypothetical protein